jgi:hypothetical protein
MESQAEIAAGKAARNRRNGMRKPEARSAVSNGHQILPGVDGRSLIARRYHDIMHAIFVDQGGVDRCSEARLQLIRRFAAAAVLAEQMEARLANGEQIDIQEHALLCSTLVRTAQRIGLDRIPRDLTPTIDEYLERHYGGDADAAAPATVRGELIEPEGDST